MKLSMIFLFLALQVSATNFGQQVLTLKAENIPLSEAFKKIEQHSNYRFYFSNDMIPEKQLVSVHATHASLAEVMKNILAGTHLRWQLIDSNRVVVSMGNEVLKRIVKGMVKDSKGSPLANVSVQIKGKTGGTATTDDGRFSIEVNTGDVLIFSIVGYAAKEVIVSDANDMEVILTAANNELDQVVVVGYGTQKKLTLTNAVSQINGAELGRRSVSSIQQALQGQLPGVAVQDLGGAPGNPNSVIRVRGLTTFNTNTSSTSGFDLSKNDALVIVDGAEQRLADINPNDIATITVLKDAASTAIYGSRATNGVILVSTKNARKGSAQVDYNPYFSLQRAINRPEQMDINDYMHEQQVAYRNAGLPVPLKFSDSSIAVWVNATDRYRYPLPNTWFQTLFTTASQHSQALAVSGGSDMLRSRLSVRYQDQGGVVKNYGNKIAEVRLNTDYNARKNLSFNANVNYRYNYSFQPAVEPFNSMFHGSLWAVPKYPNGTYGLSTQGNNPLMYSEISGLTKTTNDYFTGIVQGTWTIIRGLSFNSFLSGRIYNTQGKAYTNAYTNRDSITGITKIVANNSLTETRMNLREYTWNNLLTYENSFRPHHLKLLAGYSQIDNVQNYLSAYRERFYTNDIQSIGQGANDGTKSNDGYDSEFRLKSYFGRVNYDYRGKYLLEVNARRDGSSRFTGDKQYGIFPSFSAGWLLSEERFWDNLKPVVQNLKLRGSYGKTGNQSAGLYTFYPSLSLAGYDFGGQVVNGYRQTTFANKELGWESTNQLDLGLDLSALSSRLTVTMDYYRKVTNDILLNLDIPGTVGLIAPYQNAGSVENKGWEFSFNYNSIPTTGGFKYSLGGNFTVNDNKVLDLKGTGPYIAGTDIDPRYIIAKGLPINTLWGYKTAGLFQSQEEISAYKGTYAANTKPGDVKYLDLNGDKKIDASDMTVIGYSFPKYVFGFNSDFFYRNFELNLLFQGAAKVNTRLSGALAEMGNQEGFTEKIYANNYWTPTHTDARFPRPVKFDLRNVASSDRLVIDGSYLRVKNIQIAYNVPQALLQKWHLQKLRLYISGTNLLTFSKLNEWHLDPETPSGRGVYYPQLSLYTFGLNLQF